MNKCSNKYPNFKMIKHFWVQKKIKILKNENRMEKKNIATSQNEIVHLLI
jgi:hypothetical protein